MKTERWTALLGADPRAWLLESEEPAARWIALTHLLDRPGEDPDVVEAHDAVLADDEVRRYIGALPPWDVDTGLSGHNSPGFAPNQLSLLADMGIGAGDDPRIEELLDAMLEHQDADGRFQSFGRLRRLPEPIWSSLLCDTHAITEVLVRFGRTDDARVTRSLERMAADISETSQGTAWPCVPHAPTGFRGPGRKNDFCPQVTLEGLRALARLPDSRRPANILEVAGVALRAWRVRGDEKPYMFGHGRQFKTVKWPTFWYDIHEVLDTLGRYPGLWSAADAGGERPDLAETKPSGEEAPGSGSSRGVEALPDRRGALAELAACLIAYNFGPDGTVKPRSCYRGFETFSFGQKKMPSPLATARLCAVARRFDDLAGEIEGVDVMALGSSKGGTGTPAPPRG